MHKSYIVTPAVVITYGLTFRSLTHRLVTGLSAGVGTLRPPGHPQYAHALSGVVVV